MKIIKELKSANQREEINDLNDQLEKAIHADPTAPCRAVPNFNPGGGGPRPTEPHFNYGPKMRKECRHFVDHLMMCLKMFLR
jgi:hypothetical protein